MRPFTKREVLERHYTPAVPPNPDAPWEVIPTALCPYRINPDGTRTVLRATLLTYQHGRLRRIVTPDLLIIDVPDDDHVAVAKLQLPG